MAFEWELTRLFQKQTSINAPELGEYLEPEQIEKEMKKHRTIYEKTKATGKLLYPEGLEKYVKDNAELRKTLDHFPSIIL